MKIVHSLALSAVLATGLAVPALTMASAQDRIETGVLDCMVEGGIGFIFGSSRDLVCTFTSIDQAIAPETYVGTITKYGLDIGVTGTTLIRWAVVSPTGSIYATGGLAGTYVGAQASASVAVGVGANVLVGGLDQSFALQPVSIQAQDGVNVAVGVAELTLVSGQ